MTPQELINLPYAGMAEKQLRKQGDWRLTEEEKRDKAIYGLENCLYEAQQYLEELT